MSTDVSFADEKDSLNALSLVRSDESPERFVIFGHPDNDPNHIQMICTGNDTNDIANHLQDDKIMYILARYDTKSDMSNTVNFAYIRWLGDNVPFVKRGKFSVVHGQVIEKIGQSHISIETGSRDEITDEHVQLLLAESSGRSNKVRESTEGYQQRGFTSSYISQPTVKTSGDSKVSSNLSNTRPVLEVSDEVIASIAAVRHDLDQTIWCLARYDDCRIKGPLQLLSTGRGDLIELKSQLDPSQVLYGLYRVTDIVDEIQTVKFVFLVWVGADVRPFDKAKISTHRGVIEDHFKPFHVWVAASDLSDISDRIVKDKVMAASGTKSWVK